MTAPDLDALERAAREAAQFAPGQWHEEAHQYGHEPQTHFVSSSIGPIAEISYGLAGSEMAAYIAAANPTAILSLIAEVRELTRQNAEFAGTNTSLMNDVVQMGMARDEAERQRDEARAALEWLDISTAPITGSGDYAVEMLLTDGDYVSVGYRVEPDPECDPRGVEEFIGQSGGWITPRPTHWRPRPIPPPAGCETGER